MKELYDSYINLFLAFVLMSTVYKASLQKKHGRENVLFFYRMLFVFCVKMIKIYVDIVGLITFAIVINATARKLINLTFYNNISMYLEFRN